jgi:aspartyl/asparaginyl beta-hydroxylase (cupin superfamily)
VDKAHGLMLTTDKPLPRKEPLVALKRQERYHGSLPYFFEPEWFPELQPLRDNWRAIRDEILAFEKNNGTIKGLDSNPYVAPQIEGVEWSNIFLENFMIRHHKNRKKFPVTSAVVDQLDCTFVVISILSPQTIIKPHFGDTNGIVRAHLGLVIPSSLPECGIRVGDEERGWEEGELVLFTEAYLHGAWNNTTAKRYVLVVDFVPPFMEQSKMTVCATLLGAQSYNYLEKRFPLLEKLSDRAANLLCSLIAIGWRLYLPVQRAITLL